MATSKAKSVDLVHVQRAVIAKHCLGFARFYAKNFQAVSKRLVHAVDLF